MCLSLKNLLPSSSFDPDPYLPVFKKYQLFHNLLIHQLFMKQLLHDASLGVGNIMVNQIFRLLALMVYILLGKQTINKQVNR